jgi:hypothetical protein
MIKEISRLKEIKSQVDEAQANNPEMYNSWLKTRKSIEYRMMARQVFANVSTGITTSKKEVQEMMKQRDELADIVFCRKLTTLLI